MWSVVSRDYSRGLEGSSFGEVLRELLGVVLRGSLGVVLMASLGVVLKGSLGVVLTASLGVVLTAACLEDISDREHDWAWLRGPCDSVRMGVVSVV